MKFFTKKLVILLLPFMQTINIYAQEMLDKLEYDGVYFQISQNKFIEAKEASSLRGYLKFGKGNRFVGDFPKIQYSLNAETAVTVDKFEKIIVKGAEYSSDNYVIAISPVQLVRGYYIWSLSRPLYSIGSDNPDVKYVYTPQFQCKDRFYLQERFDSITAKISLSIKIRKNPQTNATEIALGSKPESDLYVLWFWARNTSVNDKLYYFKYSPAIPKKISQ
jgi:hypothetical protein